MYVCIYVCWKKREKSLINPRATWAKTKKIYVFYVFWTQAIILRKVIRRLASGVSCLASCEQNLAVKNFQFQIISKSFDQSPSYLV